MIDNSLLNQAIKDMTDARVTHCWKDKLGSTGGTGGGNVITGYISKSGVKATRTYPCHNPIHGFKDAEVLWSAFGYRTSREVAHLYHSWLINDSPWAKAGVVPKHLSPQFMFQTGFVFEDLYNTPANLLHNFLIASRMAAEWPALINAWYKLVTEYLVDPSFAFIMLTVLILSGENLGNTKSFFDGDSCFANKDKYDWPLDMARATEEYVKNFCSGKPVGQSTWAFSPTTVTAPVNTLWGALLDTKDPKTYINILRNKYRSSKIVQMMSPMSGLYIDVNIFTPDDALSLILEESKPFKKAA